MSFSPFQLILRLFWPPGPLCYSGAIHRHIQNTTTNTYSSTHKHQHLPTSFKWNFAQLPSSYQDNTIQYHFYSLFYCTYANIFILTVPLQPNGRVQPLTVCLSTQQPSILVAFLCSKWAGSKCLFWYIPHCACHIFINVDLIDSLERWMYCCSHCEHFDTLQAVWMSIIMEVHFWVKLQLHYGWVSVGPVCGCFALLVHFH